MQILKRCSKAGCRKLIQAYESYCEQHQGHGYREYNKARRRNDPEYVQFYKSSAWITKRKQILLRDDYLCRRCLEDLGLFTSAKIVHHIREYRDYPELGLDDDNLVSVCNSCHEWIHHNNDSKWIKE